MTFSLGFRPEDDALLERLEDESILERLFAHHAGVAIRSLDRRVYPHPRAAGLVGAVRLLAGGAEIVRAAEAGDLAKLARFIEAPPMRGKPPELLHHIALYYGRVASALAAIAPEAAANAWTRSMAAWIALGEEHAYLARLEEAVIGPPRGGKKVVAAIPPRRVPVEVVADLGARAEDTVRDLAPAGRAALLALAWIGDAVRMSGFPAETAHAVTREAERRRNGAVDAALAVVGEGLDDANVRGDHTSSGRELLLRAIDVWNWSAQDEAVEQFVVDRLSTIGWEHYRARSWGALRHLLEPFRPMIEHLAGRIEKDPTRIAYAAPCAQMYVFLSDVESYPTGKLLLAEHAVKICPTHRNGRLILAALLCDQAMSIMRTMVLFARRDEVERAEGLVARAERLYPQASELPEAKGMLERVKKGRIAI